MNGASEPARFITFEGGEGTGKSTQVRLLCERLTAAGIGCIRTREPGGAPGAEEIRKLLVEGAIDRWDPLTEALLHFAARKEHVEKTVQPALAASQWVISDRFADSTVAYQGYGHGLGREMVERLYDLVLGDFTPDLTLILDMPVAEGLARAAGRATPQGAVEEDRYERMNEDFHERLRQGYLDIAKRHPGRCAVIDASTDPETVQRAVCTVIVGRLGTHLLTGP